MASSDLGRRVGVAAVGIPGVIALIWMGGWPFTLAMAALGAAGAHEVCRLAEARGWRPFVWIGAPGAAALVLLAGWTGSMEAWAVAAWWVVIVAGLGSLAAAVFMRGPEGDPLPAVGSTLLGLIWVGAPLAFALFLRTHPGSAWTQPGWPGTFLVIFPLTVTWFGDSCAYFGGRAIGGRKLLPSVSPAKTVSGGVAGLLGAMGSGALLAWLLLPFLGGGLPLTVAAGALLGLVIGVAAQVGDLAESVLKREAGLKDSGSLLPGHGGVLDRFDAVFFTLPLTYLLLPLFMGWGR